MKREPSELVFPARLSIAEGTHAPVRAVDPGFFAVRTIPFAPLEPGRQPPTDDTQACATAAGCSCLAVTSRFSLEMAVVVSFASMLLSTLATPDVATDL